MYETRASEDRLRRCLAYGGEMSVALAAASDPREVLGEPAQQNFAPMVSI